MIIMIMYIEKGKPHFIQNPEKIDIPIWQLAQYYIYQSIYRYK